MRAQSSGRDGCNAIGVDIAPRPDGWAAEISVPRHVILRMYQCKLSVAMAYVGWATKRPWWSRCNRFADWLKELDMSEHTQRFAENDIDLVVVPDLTDQHLKDLGVSLGNGLNLKKGPVKRGAEPRAAACVGEL
jgi:SAM domain (Sterile alpha motif)